MVVDRVDGDGSNPEYIAFKPLMTGLDDDGNEQPRNFAIEEASDNYQDHVTSKAWQEQAFAPIIVNAIQGANLPDLPTTGDLLQGIFYNIDSGMWQLGAQSTGAVSNTTYFSFESEIPELTDGPASERTETDIYQVKISVDEAASVAATALRLKTEIYNMDLTNGTAGQRPSKITIVDQNIEGIAAARTAAQTLWNDRANNTYQA